MSGAPERARALVAGFQRWVGDPYHLASPSVNEQARLTTIAAAGLRLRESGGHPGSGTGDGSTFDGCVCFWCEAARAFDATVAGALGGDA